MRAARDRTVTIGALPQADPGRFKEMTQRYENIGLPRWEATRRAYTEVTTRSYARRGSRNGDLTD